MKADWGLLGGAAAAMLALPLLVLAWSGTPLGTGLPGGTTSDPTPQQSNILPGTNREEPEEPPADHRQDVHPDRTGWLPYLSG